MTTLDWTGPAEFTIDSVAFALVEAGTDLAHPGDPERTMFVFKTAAMVEDLAMVLRRTDMNNIIELGIFTGGSVALTAKLAEPNTLVAVEKVAGPTAHLERFIAEQGLDSVVRPYWEVDQADTGRLREIVSAEFAGNPIDLVYDDASHVYGPTRASFEELFPRLRPGGLYIIEDWPSEQGFLRLLIAHHESRSDEIPDDYVTALAERLASALDDPADPVRHDFARAIVTRGFGPVIGVDRPPSTPTEFVPLVRLVHELVELRCEHGDVIRSIDIRANWVVIERGEAPVPHDFRLEDFVADDFGSLGTPVSGS